MHGNICPQFYVDAPTSTAAHKIYSDLIVLSNGHNEMYAAYCQMNERLCALEALISQFISTEDINKLVDHAQALRVLVNASIATSALRNFSK